ncbi:Nif3-like dinuclear metal center hexameric protein [Pelotomaculum propionicicum]|uniref:Nif3-like dinuclear metal center hexameric protein n=1 Tax=Pelotomaculum propionicicum TaxID=258475 RepID=UPI003B7F2C40
MSVKCASIFRLIEEFAPAHLAESWDNCGLQVGDPQAGVEKALLTIDVNLAVAREAVDKGAGLILSHHPLLLKPPKAINTRQPLGELISFLIRNNITVYAAHTNLDAAAGGVNSALAERLGLIETAVLQQTGQTGLFKLVVFIPVGHEEKVRAAILEAGAGWIGNYSHCSFMTGGTGTFKPLAGASPYYGRTGELEQVEEVRFETIVPAGILEKAVSAMLDAHPYEEVAYDILPLKNRVSNCGLGRVGKLIEPVSLSRFAGKVKENLAVPAVRIGGRQDSIVKTVAVCGGSGADLWPEALKAGADTIVTGDVKYHTAQEITAAGMNFIDAGHYGTESVVLPVLLKYLGDICGRAGIDIGLILSQTNTDPFAYF